MSRGDRKVKILLSSDRMQELFKFLRVGDRTIVTVQRSMGKGKYLVELHGVKLIATFKGSLHYNEKLYAVVNSLLPHVVLRITSAAEALIEKCTTLKERIAVIDSTISLQPFIADMIQNIFILVDRYKSFLPSSQKKESLDLIKQQLEKNVININHTFSDTVTIKDVLDTMRSPVESLKKCQHIIYEHFNEPTSSLFAQRLDAFFELKQEFEDLTVQLLLLQEMNASDMTKKGHWYYQIPIYFKNHYGTFEVFLTLGESPQVYNADIWFHHIGVDYFKISIHTDTRTIIIHKVHDIRNKVRIKSLITLIRERMRELDWIVYEDEKVFMRTNDRVHSLYKPVVFDIKMPQHFTMVA